MSKILILGAAGMLGHKLCQQLSDHEIIGTVRKDKGFYDKYSHIFDNTTLIDNIDVLDNKLLEGTIQAIKPDVVINCVGIIKQLAEAKDPIVSIKINALLPHQIANICEKTSSRLIQISTDCVFDGMKGFYTESDISNATDLYGRTKFLGEVDNRHHCLTLRTSIIGRELYTTSGLIEWFLTNRGGKVKGFTKAIYTGFSTLALTEIIDNLIKNHPDVSGLYQVSSEPINKYDLICLVNKAMGLNIEIEQETEFLMDRSLLCDRFKKETDFTPTSWPDMIKQLASDPTPYDNWRI
jgi:dTDP-4-dehydrorhamnose reductase